MRVSLLRTVLATWLLFPSLAFAAQPSDDDDDSEEVADDDDDDDTSDADTSDDDTSDDDKSDADKSDADKSDDDADKSDEDDESDGKASEKRTWGHDGNVPKEPNKDAMSGEYRWDVHLLDFMTFSMGFLGGAGGNFLDKPGDQSVQGSENVEPEYPGFAGLTTGVGPTFEVRFLGFAGIELDVLVQSDTGSANLKVTQTAGGAINSQKFTVEISQDAIHVPLLFKGAIPGRIVTPLLFLGPEFVIVNKSTSTISEGTVPAFHGVDYTVAKNPDSYTTFMFGLGLEFNLPIPYVDARVPFNLRGMINPGISDEREGRSDIGGSAPDNITSVAFSTEWKFQAVGNIGLSVHF